MKKAILVSLLAWFGAIQATPAQTITGNAADGAKKNAMCIGCHGIVGYQSSFPRVYRVPMISGQERQYIEAALKAYRQGDRRHPTMRAIAGSLSDQDIADLAAFYADHGGQVKLPAPPPAQLPAALQEKMAACTACHGTNFSTPVTPGAARLAGQHSDYLAAALRSYQKVGGLTGNANPIMEAQVKLLDPGELDAVAAYLSGLPGQLKTVPQAGIKH